MKNWVKENWLKVLFSLSSGFGFAILIALISDFLLNKLGVNNVEIWIAFIEGTLAFGIISAWMFNKFRK